MLPVVTVIPLVIFKVLFSTSVRPLPPSTADVPEIVNVPRMELKVSVAVPIIPSRIVLLPELVNVLFAFISKRPLMMVGEFAPHVPPIVLDILIIDFTAAALEGK